MTIKMLKLEVILFFKLENLGVSIVIRSEDQSKIKNCNSQILKFVDEKKD